MKGLLTFSLPLCRVRGIPVLVHWSWFVVAYFALLNPVKLYQYSSPVWHLLEYLSLFGLVLVHEFGHAFACRSVGGSVDRILLWPLGGLALVKPPPRPGATLWSIAAGPLVNLVLAPPLFGLILVAGLSGWQTLYPDPFHFLIVVLSLDVVLLLFNLVPVYPLDGGQILHALLWYFVGQGRALTIVSFLGVMFGTALTTFDTEGLSVLGWFILVGAVAGMFRGAKLSQPGGTALLNSIPQLQNGAFEEARSSCSEVIDQRRDHPADLATAHLFRGISELALQHFEEAGQDHAEALRVLPCAVTYLASGVTRLARAEVAEARADLTHAICCKPALALAHRFRGVAHCLSGDPQAAITDSTEALRLDRKDILAYLTRSCSLAQLHEYDRASADFAAGQRLDAERAQRTAGDGVLRLAPTDYAASLAAQAQDFYGELVAAALVQRWSAAGTPAAPQANGAVLTPALKLFGLLIWLFPRWSRLRRERAAGYMLAGDWPRALADHEASLRIDPSNFLALNGLAWFLATCPDAGVRDGARAVELARQACEASGWKNANVIDTLAAACAEAGQFGEAVRWQKTAMEDATYRAKQGEKAIQRLRMYEEIKPYREVSGMVVPDRATASANGSTGP
jgi:Zn-dependent protease/tetratricopeptide (TPR) repeat protein